MEENLLKLKNDASSLILSCEDAEELNSIKLDFLGKNGKLTLLLKELKTVPEERRAEVGRLANEIKNTIEELISSSEVKFKGKKLQERKEEALDVTIPGKRPPLGHLHLVTQAIEQISGIFEKIGFLRVRYPEVEWDYYAFTSLNFPQNHPARDDWETFFIEGEQNSRLGRMLLTPHTSSGQIREMEKGKLPIKMLNIAKCYRRQSDVSHTQMFHQFEGLVIAEAINISHLKGVLDYFFKSYLGEKRNWRIRPYHFQFTEPSFEVDISCEVCNGKGCRLCKAGWLELGGAGMVHPNVLRAGKVDPTKYTGFAFGWGVERVLMMKSGLELDDLRILYSNRLDFLEQF